MKALITGATRGIGHAIAVSLASAGHDIATFARNKDELQALETELKNFNVSVIAMQVDGMNKEEIQDFCLEVERQWGFVDILVNNAGMFVPGSLFEEPDHQFENQMQLNVYASYYITKFFGKIMKNRLSGHIFNICSIASKEPAQNAGSYSVTKAALLSLNHVMRQELAPFHVKVTAILPGATLTSSWNDDENQAVNFVKPQDIADMILTTLSLTKHANVDEIIIRPLREM